MTTVTYSAFRAHLSHFLDRAEENCEEIVVSRGKGRTAILLSLDEFLSLQETAYLLSSPKNRRHLEMSRAEAARGKTRKVKFS